MNKLSIRDLSLHGKKLLIRVDFNVPLDEQQNITDNTRILAAIPTIQYALDQKCSIILMSHLGRPKGVPSSKLSLLPCAKALENLLHTKVIMAPDCIGKETEQLADQLQPGQILVLENLRFHKAEEKPQLDPSFAQNLAKLADIYINDAFGAAHRNHSSVVSICQHFPNKAASGLLLEKEIHFLGNTLLSPPHPFYALIGGAKISTKIGVLKTLLQKVDKLFIGGAMCYTFLASQKISIGKSLVEMQYLQEAQNLLSSKEGQEKIFLPIDHLVAENIDNNAQTKIVSTEDGIPENYYGVDIGPKTSQLYQAQLKDAALILWNGPLGIQEIPSFSKGTFEMAEFIASSKATTIAGGGDSLAAINQAKVPHLFNHLSTGGGASLEFIELGTLPAIEALSDKKKF